jgi:hypothetical protein
LVELARDSEARQNMPGVQNPVIGELDQEVIDGILKRFQGAEDQGQELRQPNNYDDQRD